MSLLSRIRRLFWNDRTDREPEELLPEPAAPEPPVPEPGPAPELGSPHPETAEEQELHQLLATLEQGAAQLDRDRLARAVSGLAEAGRGQTAVDLLRRLVSRLPDEAEGGLDALLVAPAEVEEKWNGPYLKESQLLDPWGNPYIYISEGEYNPGSFDLVSYGADGQEGGEGDDADVFNN